MWQPPDILYHVYDPGKSSTPCLNVPALILTAIYVGDEWLSTLTSAADRCTLGSNSKSDGTTTSPTLKKPKKHIVAAAHNIKASLTDCLVCHASHSCASSGRVIGSLVRVSPPVSFFTPRIMYSSLLVSSMWGFPRPNEICVY